MGLLWAIRSCGLKTKRIFAFSLGSLFLLVILAWFLLVIVMPEPHGLGLGKTEVGQLTKRAKEGSGEACWCLSLYYMKDDEQALYWLKKGVTYGNSSAQYHMYSILANKNPDKAVDALELLKKSAIQDNVYAQNELGDLYRDGKIVERNWDQAEYFYRQAGRNGYKPAMYNLAKLLTEKSSKKATLVEAYKWSVIALFLSHEKSVFADDLRKQMDLIIEKAAKLQYEKRSLVSTAESMAAEEGKLIRHVDDLPDYLGACKKLGEDLRDVGSK